MEVKDVLNFVVVHGHVGRRGKMGWAVLSGKMDACTVYPFIGERGACGVVANRGLLSLRVLISRC